MASIPRRGTPAQSATLAAALDYLARGWCVIPAAGKTACATWKQFKSKRPTEAQIHNWFGNSKAHNIAIILGEVSGFLVCRDFDVTESYVAWSKANPKLAKALPTVWTPRGRHVYCHTTSEQISAAGKAYVDLGDGELRLWCCYCIAPPSMHPAGFPYRWLHPPAPEVPLVKDLAAAGLRKNWSCPASEGQTECRPIPKESRRLTEQTEQTDAVRADPGSQKKTKAIYGQNDFAKNARAPGVMDEEVRRAIQESLPKGPGERNRRLFELARRLKSIPHLTGATGRDLEPIVEHWHELAHLNIRTKDFYTSLSEFLTAWDNVKFPEGCDPMATVLAETLRENLPACALRFKDPRMQRLIAVCRALQRHPGEEAFYLSCRSAGKLFKISHETAAKWLRLLEQLGVISTVVKGDQSTRRASRYRYLGD